MEVKEESAEEEEEEVEEEDLRRPAEADLRLLRSVRGGERVAISNIIFCLIWSEFHNVTDAADISV